MGKRVKTKSPAKGGRPPALVERPELHAELVKTLELGVPINLACDGVGISTQAFRNWINRGAGEHEARETDPTYEPDPDEDMYVQLFLDVKRARSRAATRNLALIQQSAQGGVLTNVTTRKYRDSEGNMVEERSENRTAPDWRAAAWYLEKSHRDEFGKDAVQHTVTGADGGAVQVEVTPSADLAQRISEALAAQIVSMPLELEGGADTGYGDAVIDVEHWDVDEHGQPVRGTSP